jgi:hypothetical protein
VLNGCASTPPTRFYDLPSLAGLEAPSPAPAVKRDLTIGVGPVTLPAYLDRPQIVTRASRVKFAMAEFEQWAAPLKDTFANGLAENLSLLIPTDRVVLHPWPRTTVLDYQITVEVTRFDGGMGGEVVLAARWSLVGADGKALIIRKSRFTTTANVQDHEATVTAMSRTLEALSREMTATLLTMTQQAAAR